MEIVRQSLSLRQGALEESGCLMISIVTFSRIRF
jgi:hypothetical protein